MKLRMKNRVTNNISRANLNASSLSLSNDFTNLVHTIKSVFASGAKDIKYTFEIEYDMPEKDNSEDLSIDFWVDVATGNL